MNSAHSNKKFIVDTDAAPRAIGPYSQAVSYGGLLFVSGQIATDPKTGEVVGGGVEAQTRRAMNNLQAILMAAGLDFSHVLKTTVYLRNMNDYQMMNDVYGLYFDYSPPARVCVEVSRLPKDVLVEVDCIAAAPTDYASRMDDPTAAESDTGAGHVTPDQWEEEHIAAAAAVHDAPTEDLVRNPDPEEVLAAVAGEPPELGADTSQAELDALDLLDELVEHESSVVELIDDHDVHWDPDADDAPPPPSDADEDAEAADVAADAPANEEADGEPDHVDPDDSEPADDASTESQSDAESEEPSDADADDLNDHPAEPGESDSGESDRSMAKPPLPTLKKRPDLSARIASLRLQKTAPTDDESE